MKRRATACIQRMHFAVHYEHVNAMEMSILTIRYTLRVEAFIVFYRDFLVLYERRVLNLS